MTITNNKTRVASSAAAFALVVTQLFAPLSLLVPKVAADPKGEQNVTICHRTNSITNPYVQETVAASSVDGDNGNDNGQGDHLLEHTGPVFDVNTTYPTPHNGDQWGDIIPPFDTNNASYDNPQTSLNWVDNATGQAIWNNGCNLPGTVKVNKLVDTDHNGTYDGGNDVANTIGFQWGLDGATPSRDMGTTDTGVTSGSHTVTENSLKGYSFTGWYYTGDEGSSCTNPEGTTLPARVTVKDNETTDITLCNQADPGTITIVKDAQPTSDQPFGFTFQQQGSETSTPFTLIDDGTTKNATTFSDLALGTYDVTEGATSNWVLTGISCSEGADVSYDQADGKVSITLHAGDSVMCTYTNQEKGTIVVHKHTLPAGDKTEFGITATGTGTIDGNADRTITDGGSQTYVVTPGTYNVDENDLPDGWTQTSNTCKDLVINEETTTASCDITNTKAAELTIVKVADPESNQAFDFTSEQLGGFSLIDDGTGTHNSKTFTGLSAGTYSIAEQEPEDWAASDITCNTESGVRVDLADASLSVRLSAGQHITCTFENDKSTGNGGEPLPGIISGHKFNDVNGNGKWDQGEPTLKGWQITLTKECLVSGATITNAAACQNTVVGTTTTDTNGAYSFSNLPEGKYKVCEVMQPKWTQTFPGTADGCTELTVDGSGDTLTADFGNKPVPQVLGSSTTAPQLVNTGADASKSIMVGLAILGGLGAVHFLSLRRKDYSL